MKINQNPLFSATLRLLDWEAWADGLTDKAGWAAWAAEGGDVAWGAGTPAASDVPAVLRRRAGRSDRLALEVAWRLAPKDGGIPCVLASRHGQIARSVQLLESLVQGAPLSPMDFSVSVHNATAGLLGMARADRSAASALAAGRESLGAALLEAAGLLREGANEVLVVYHDEPPPSALDGTWDGEPAGMALGLRLGHSGGQGLAVGLEAALDAADDDPRPQALALARLLALGQGGEAWRHARHRWTWQLRP